MENNIKQNQVFGKEWFVKEQNRLLWLLNHSTYFRKDLGIQECDLPHNVPITEITPNSFSWGDRYFEKDGEWYLERTTDFRGTDKFAHRMYYAFYPVWNIAHKFDLSLANRFAPALNLGFDTLTTYPDASSGGTTCDGDVLMDTAETDWSTLRGAAGNNCLPTNANLFARFTAGATTNKWTQIRRAIMTFDTHLLTTSATITAVVLSLYYGGKADNLSATPDCDIYTATPAANNTLANGDYAQTGTTSQTGAVITYANWTSASYNDFTFNATGRGNISKDGISKFSFKNANYDVANSAPPWVKSVESYIYAKAADTSGTANDPKLVVTYTLPAVGPANLKSYNTNLAANIKSINTNLIANVKTLNTNA